MPEVQQVVERADGIGFEESSTKEEGEHNVQHQQGHEPQGQPNDGEPDIHMGRNEDLQNEKHRATDVTPC